MTGWRTAYAGILSMIAGLVLATSCTRHVVVTDVNQRFEHGMTMLMQAATGNTEMTRDTCSRLVPMRTCRMRGDTRRCCLQLLKSMSKQQRSSLQPVQIRT